jgi:hypothetical protein
MSVVVAGVVLPDRQVEGAAAVTMAAGAVGPSMAPVAVVAAAAAQLF